MVDLVKARPFPGETARVRSSSQGKNATVDGPLDANTYVLKNAGEMSEETSSIPEQCTKRTLKLARSCPDARFT